jgi:hypothetical protein
MNPNYEKLIKSIAVKKSQSLREIMVHLKSLSSMVTSLSEEKFTYKNYVSSVVPNESILTEFVDFFDGHTVLDVFPENGLWSYLLSKARCKVRAVSQFERLNTSHLFFDIEKISFQEAVQKYVVTGLFVVVMDRVDNNEVEHLLSCFDGDRVILIMKEDDLHKVHSISSGFWSLVHWVDDLCTWTHDVTVHAFFYERKKSSR